MSLVTIVLCMYREQLIEQLLWIARAVIGHGVRVVAHTARRTAWHTYGASVEVAQGAFQAAAIPLHSASIPIPDAMSAWSLILAMTLRRHLPCRSQNTAAHGRRTSVRLFSRPPSLGLVGWVGQPAQPQLTFKARLWLAAFFLFGELRGVPCCEPRVVQEKSPALRIAWACTARACARTRVETSETRSYMYIYIYI